MDAARYLRLGQSSALSALTHLRDASNSLRRAAQEGAPEPDRLLQLAASLDAAASIARDADEVTASLMPHVQGL